MKTLLASSAFALMIAPAAFADQYAVVDYNADGVITDADYIGHKSTLDDGAMVAAPAQYEYRATTRTVTVPGSTNVTASFDELAPRGSNYVNIGELPASAYGTLESTPATTRTVVERERVLVAPAIAGPTTAQVTPMQSHGATDALVPTTLGMRPDYVPPMGQDAVFTAAEMGFTADKFENDRLSVYDVNGDGVVTEGEALAQLDPLQDPNVQAVADDYRGTLEIVTPDLKNLGQ